MLADHHLFHGQVLLQVGPDAGQLVDMLSIYNGTGSSFHGAIQLGRQKATPDQLHPSRTSKAWDVQLPGHGQRLSCEHGAHGLNQLTVAIQGMTAGSWMVRQLHPVGVCHHNIVQGDATQSVKGAGGLHQGATRLGGQGQITSEVQVAQIQVFICKPVPAIATESKCLLPHQLVEDKTCLDFLVRNAILDRLLVPLFLLPLRQILSWMCQENVHHT
mmetsp:Transcript_66736/g.81675  ORF Transcript_66736/g.81675 Transcript_66736/m.81675 type:complete len:216 (-) Transcript_66736:150-797(-)